MQTARCAPFDVNVHAASKQKHAAHQYTMESRTYIKQSLENMKQMQQFYSNFTIQ